MIELTYYFNVSVVNEYCISLVSNCVSNCGISRVSNLFDLFTKLIRQKFRHLDYKKNSKSYL